MVNLYMKTILITGGAGFLGSHLCEKLLNSDNKIICLDNLYTGNINNIKHLLDNPNFSFVEHDIIEPYNTINVDEIYNLACPASPPHYQKDPIKTLKTSVIGIINLLEIAKNNNAKILQASTSEIYGNPLMHPQEEEYFGNVNTIGLRSCYDEGKRCAETIISDYRRMYNIETRIVRIFNTYGPKMSPNDGRIISNFIVQALNNNEITVYGDGSQTRSFCYVDDTIDGLIKLMNSNYNMPVNIGNPQEKTVLDIAKLVIKLTNSKSKIVYKPLPSDDPVKRKPDIAKAKSIINWTPKTELELGLSKTIEYFKTI